MTGEENLEILLSSMSPVLKPEEYVFCTIKDGKYGIFSELNPIASFQEDEGLSLIVEKSQAEKAGLTFNGVFKCISLLVHSSLNAVGLTAAISTSLANKNISANVVAGHFHDHVFVPIASAENALKTLKVFSL